MTDGPDGEGTVAPPLLHSADVEPRSALIASVCLYQIVHKLLDEYECDADVSRKTCLDVINHYDTDIRRHMSHQEDGVDPAKHIAYMVFWLRKLKPISNAFYTSVLNAPAMQDDEALIYREVHDINERIAIALMKRLIVLAAFKGLIGFSGKEQIDKQIELIDEYFDEFKKKKSDLLYIKSDTFHSLIYDMRYRTFGPHHFTHIVNNVIFNVNQKMMPAEAKNEAV